jgi:hypothetical protein
MRATSELSLYDILGVDAGSDSQQIKAAYYAAIKTCHPDIDPGPAAHGEALKLIEAYRVLSDPERRRLYNAQLRLNTSLPKEAEGPPARTQSVNPGAPEEAFVRPAAARAEPVVPPPAVEPEPVVSPPAAESEPEAPSGLRSPAAARERRPMPRGFGRAAVAVLGFAAGFALLVLMFLSVKTPAERDGAAPAVPPAVTAVEAASKPDTPSSPCLDLFSGLKGDELYRECVKTRVKLQLRMMRLASGEEMERDELQDAMAEIRQAVGAEQVNMSSTHSFFEESVAALAGIKNSASDEQVRRTAENYYYYYVCEALKRCAQ